MDDAAAGDGHQAQCAILVAHREFPFGAGGDVVDFSGGKIRDIRAAAAEAVALLGLLAAEIEVEGVLVASRLGNRSRPNRRGSCRAGVFRPCRLTSL